MKSSFHNRLSTRALTFIFILSLVFSACSQAAAPTPTPAPFNRYGQVLMDITYCNPDGQAQKLDFYFPSAGGPWPVFLYIHGGGWNKGDKAEGAGWRPLTDLGYLVVSVNYRLAAYNVKFPMMIQDVKCAVRFLRAHAAEYNLDPDRIVALGASAGAHLAALLAVADTSAGWDVGEYLDQSSRVQAVVTESVFADFTREMPSSIQSALYFALGDFPGTPSAINTTASPVTYVSPDDPPFLIIHGEKDGLTPVTQAIDLDARLKDVGVSSKLVIIKNGEHSLTSLTGDPAEPSPEQVYQIILDFLKTNLMK